MEQRSSESIQNNISLDTAALAGSSATVQPVTELVLKTDFTPGALISPSLEDDKKLLLGPPQPIEIQTIKTEQKEQPVAVSVSFSNVLWQHRKSSSPTSILPDIMEEETQDEGQIEDPGEHFEVVDLTADSEEDSRGMETPSVVAAPSSGNQGTTPALPPLKLVESGNTKKQSFMCVSCKKYYISVSNLQRSKDGTGIEYHCTMCPLVFNFEKSFCKHLKLHSVRHVLFCQQCKDLFGSKSFFCYVCNYEFPTVKQLEAHQKLHKEEPLTCAVCTRRFETESCLNDHKKICTNSKFFGVERKTFRGLPWQKLFRCDMCQEQFITQKMLVEHRANCNEPRPKPKYFECGICTDSFLSSEDMVAHKLSHNSPMASYACDSCGLKFFTAGGLASHKISHVKRYTSCSPPKKPLLSEPEANSNDNVPQPLQQVKNLQDSQEIASNEKRVSSPATCAKPERIQKNLNRQRLLLPKAGMRNCKSPTIQTQSPSKNQLSGAFNTSQQNPKVSHSQYQQLPGNRVIQHEIMQASSVYQPQMLPGHHVPQDASQNQHIVLNSGTQHEQLATMTQQQLSASSAVPSDNASSNVVKHQQMSVNNCIQYQHVSTNTASQYQMPREVVHSQQQVGINNLFQHNVATSTDQCQETESNNPSHQQLLSFSNVQNPQSSVYSNGQNHVTNNSFHNQQNMNVTDYNNLSVHSAPLPQHPSTDNTAQSQQWSVDRTHVPTNTSQCQLSQPNNSSQLQQHLPNVASQQTLIAVDPESQNPHILQQHQVNQVMQQQFVCNSTDQQQSENNVTQNPQFLANDATYQMLPTHAVQQQVQTNNTLGTGQTVTNSVESQQVLNSSSAQNHPLIINSAIQQQLISNLVNNQAQNQQLLAADISNQLLLGGNVAQNQQLTDNNVVNNQHILENDTTQKQQSPDNNMSQSQHTSANNSQNLQLLGNNCAQAQQLAEINMSQKENQSYGQQMTADLAAQNQQLFAHGMPQNQHYSVNQHSLNGMVHSQQPTYCFPFQHQAFPANVVILQPQLSETPPFHQTSQGVSQQQQLQANNLQQQQPQQQQPQNKLPNNVYSHQLFPANLMYHFPANSSLAHLPHVPQNIQNQHMLPANMVYQLQPSLANLNTGQQITSPSQMLPINFLQQQQLSGNISSQSQFPGAAPQHQQVAGVVAGNQVFPASAIPNYQQFVMANSAAPNQIFLPNGLTQHQQLAFGMYPQPRMLLPNITPQQMAPVKQDSTSDKDQCCDTCCEEQKSGSSLCHHGKKFKRLSESSNIIVQFVPNYQGMHHTVVNIQAPPENVTVVKSSS